jgi:hypothetical protein
MYVIITMNLFMVMNDGGSDDSWMFPTMATKACDDVRMLV